MFKIIIPTLIEADIYQKFILEILLLSSPPWRTVPWSNIKWCHKFGVPMLAKLLLSPRWSNLMICWSKLKLNNTLIECTPKSWLKFCLFFGGIKEKKSMARRGILPGPFNIRFQKKKIFPWLVMCESTKIKETWHYPYGFIISFMVNTYFILQISHAQTFKIRYTH